MQLQVSSEIKEPFYIVSSTLGQGLWPRQKAASRNRTEPSPRHFKSLHYQNLSCSKLRAEREICMKQIVV